MFALIFLLHSLTFSVRANEGPIIDPDGGRRLAVHRDNGSCIDPDGRCVGGLHTSRVKAQGDRGAGLDPNG